MHESLAARAVQLRAARTPYVEAVVVRAQRPTSAYAGARALILGDGTIEGFVGGACAKDSLRLQALRVLETGEPLLLKIVPGPDGAGDATEGTITVANPCLSGGALEIFLEPHVPAPRLVVVGEAPIARALVELAGHVGFDVTSGGEEGLGPLEDAAVVVASHGEAEERTLEQALNGHAAYVGLVASRARGADVLGRLDVAPEQLARVHTPAGLDLHARTPQESALAILAEIVRERAAAPGPELSPATAMDPICGMEVAVSAATVQSERGGEITYFCCEGCRTRFEAEAAHA